MDIFKFFFGANDSDSVFDKSVQAVKKNVGPAAKAIQEKTAENVSRWGQLAKPPQYRDKFITVYLGVGNSRRPVEKSFRPLSVGGRISRVYEFRVAHRLTVSNTAARDIADQVFSLFQIRGRCTPPSQSETLKAQGLAMMRRPFTVTRSDENFIFLIE